MSDKNPGDEPDSPVDGGSGAAPTPDDAPDIGFRLALDPAQDDSRDPARDGSDLPVPQRTEDAAEEHDSDRADRRAARRIAEDLGAFGPPGWKQVEAAFAVTATMDIAEVVYTDDERSLRADPPDAVSTRVREHRALVAELDGEPWWRLLLRLTADGEFEVGYDYGAEPFPPNQIFDPEVYRADLAEYPRGRLPVWLAAYIAPGNPQQRTPQQAAVAARADTAASVRPTAVYEDLPDFPQLWSRWACIAAGFVAARSDWGPRVSPSLGWFESSRRGGSTLYSLPNGRAVLSGGIWEAPELDAVYNDGAEMPQLYAGAPEWVTDSVLSPRASTGLMSFVYWWTGGRWFRGESPSMRQCVSAVPGVWTVDTTAGVIAGLAAQPAGPRERAAAVDLVTAADIGVVTRDTVTALFDDDEHFDIDGAMYQLSLAGVVASLPPEMPQDEALFRVRGHVQGEGIDISGYPLDQLVCDRFSCGWMVYVPVPVGELAIGRAIYYIADDGVLERSSSSVAPTTFVKGFERRFRERQGI
ncbi:hypothetical protein [Nocardia flavorosea]|uniref:hypothetical protein n=1 Tax=Nocardia flavorosea TaxID=53429 RepID=UPI001FDFEDA4|nr:hypothetical protein [Nocardia flavorosea]